MAKNITVLGIVPTRTTADLVVADLIRARVPASDVSVLLANEDSTRDIALEHGTKAPEGAVAGGASGGALGGTLGALAGLGLLAIPGAGPFLAAGPILATLSGAAIGAAMGSLAGALVGVGVPEVHATAYEGKVRGGGALLSVHADDATRAETIERILRLHGADDVTRTREAKLPTANPMGTRDVRHP